jgi:hypothetical protein
VQRHHTRPHTSNLKLDESFFYSSSVSETTISTLDYVFVFDCLSQGFVLCSCVCKLECRIVITWRRLTQPFCSGELGVLLVTATYCNDFSYYKTQKLVKMTFLSLRGAHLVTYISKHISSPTFRSTSRHLHFEAHLVTYISKHISSPTFRSTSRHLHFEAHLVTYISKHIS